MFQPHWHLNLITAPTEEPLSLPEAKIQCRVTTSEDDDELADLITEAREYCELNIPGGRQFCTATWDMVLDSLPCGRTPLELPKPPLASVTSMLYYDASDTLVTAFSTSSPSTAYVVVTPTSLPGYIQPAVDAVWPVTACRRDAVTVRFVAGYGGPSAVPARPKRAMKLLISEWYDHREATEGKTRQTIPFGVQEILYSCGWGNVS